MEKDISKNSVSDINHQKSVSTLQKRKPSKLDNEQFHSQLDSHHEAAKLRMSSSEEKLHTFHTPVEFSWLQFWITFIYENLPPVFISPIAAIFIERSFVRAWNVTQHRGLCAISTKHNSLSFIIFSWAIIYPCSWIITLALIMRLMGAEGLVQNVDLFQMILAYIFLFMRRLIISVKYGYFRSEDYKLLGLPAPNWDEDKTNRRLVGAGWSEPAKFPGLIEDELTCAMDENDLSLQGITFQLDDNVCESMKNHPTNEMFTADKKNNDINEVNSGFVLHQILRAVYDKKVPLILSLIPLLCAFTIAFLPIVFRSYYGLEIFGKTFFENIIFIGCFLGFVSGFGIMGFGFISAYDFKRRFYAMKKLGDLINFPGVPLSNFLFHLPKSEIVKNDIELNQSLKKDNKDGELKKKNNNPYVFIDLKKRPNVFAWMNCRKTLRSFGEGFYFRIQGYTSILLMYSFFCVAVLNVIAWMQMRHHVSTIFLIMTIVVIIASISIFSISKASRLQNLSAIQRDLIRKEIFLQEEEIWNSESSENHDKNLNHLRSAKALLEQVDESINFNDLIHKPTRVLGYVANQNVIGSALGIIATGCFLAIEGFSGSGISYDLNGWFNF